MFHTSHTVAPASPHGAWGTYDTSVGRYGFITERLRILPPDTTVHDRRLWMVLRLWPTVGFLGGIVVILATFPLLGASGALLAGAITWLGPLAWLWHASRRFVRRIHEVWAGHSLVIDGTVDHALLRARATRLRTAEAQLRAGRISEQEFHARWAAVYDEFALAPRAAV